MFDYRERRRRLGERMEAEGVDGFSVRIEDIVVCGEGGGRRLNAYPAALVAST